MCVFECVTGGTHRCVVLSEPGGLFVYPTHTGCSTLCFACVLVFLLFSALLFCSCIYSEIRTVEVCRYAWCGCTEDAIKLRGLI